MTISLWIAVLQRWLLVSWGAVAAVVLAAVVYLLLAPMPEAVLPVVDIAATQRPDAAGAIDAAASDFVQRPLFAENRRPPPVVDATVVEPVVAAESVDMQGYTLLGVFGAGERSGVILGDGKDRHRMTVGEIHADEWLLESVAPRSAVFSNRRRAGVTAELFLQLAEVTGKVTPVTAPDTGTAPNEAAGMMTFDAIAKRRGQEMKKNAENEKQ